MKQNGGFKVGKMESGEFWFGLVKGSHFMEEETQVVQIKEYIVLNISFLGKNLFMSLKRSSLLEFCSSKMLWFNLTLLVLPFNFHSVHETWLVCFRSMTLLLSAVSF